MFLRQTGSWAEAAVVASFAYVSPPFARPGGDQGRDCGPAIPIDEVRVVDTESGDAAAAVPGFGAEYRALNGVPPIGHRKA